MDRARADRQRGRRGSLQLDIFGELLDSIYLYDKYGPPISTTSGRSLKPWSWTGSADHWQQPTTGSWEVRGGRQATSSSRG